ncbi:uncharacterized protein HD556DRAFT_756249 [Suillus plorans]|uniref:DUF6533 domain-containing protein n=1 Tax=Suillus plorans TaxID=116603 RepID=A0A9P7DF31_9AGAM|nr:uncharacterized protein HD556DRAFT_756249 [Suillus plorans]KAG1790003.1 hypothetical protein HD556DRAFT_756249 [Suillus plorans]
MDATEKQQLARHLYVILVANSIMVYDHMATLTDEINFIWRRPKTLSAMSFLISRYLALISCPKYAIARQLFVFLQQFVICVILIIRTYALYNRSKRLIIWVTFILIVLAGGVSAATFGQYAGTLTISPGVGCFTTSTVEISARLGLAWVAILAFEALIFVLTVYRTCKSRGLSRLRLVTRRNILDVMFHDGVMYFGAMTLCNIPNIVMYYYGPAVIRGNVGLGIFTSWTTTTASQSLLLVSAYSLRSLRFRHCEGDDRLRFCMPRCRYSCHVNNKYITPVNTYVLD